MCSANGYAKDMILWTIRGEFALGMGKLAMPHMQSEIL